MSHRLRMIVLPITLLVATGCERAGGDAYTVELSEIMTYGSGSADSGDPAAHAAAARHGGRELARIGGVAEASTGDVYVLDRSYQKIVVFNRDGALLKLMVGGQGRGPGEFQRARGLAVSEGGEVVIYDDEQRRFSLFDSDGRHRFDRPTGHDSYDLIFLGQRLLATGPLFGGRYAITEIFVDSGNRHGVIAADGPNARLIAAGEAGAIGYAKDGSVLYAHPLLGEYTRISRDSMIVSGGAALFSWLTPLTVERPPVGRMTIVPVMVRGIGELPDGNMLFIYAVSRLLPSDVDFADDVGTGIMMVVTTPSGQLLSRRQLFDDLGHGYFRILPERGELLVAHVDPYPRVTRYAMRIGRD